MEQPQKDLLSEVDLQADAEVRRNLYESAKWSKTIAIFMFAAAGLVFVGGLAGNNTIGRIFSKAGGVYNIINEIGPAGMKLIVVLAALFIVLVYYFLLQFSSKTKAALQAENTAELVAGLKSLKIFFIITTVLAALGLINNISQLF
ncbi:MAG: hypothetical protein U0V75_12420 [Ferruginibacter sp.]